METLPTDVFLDILTRAGGWTITMPGEVVMVVTALSVCKQWRQGLLGSPAHAVQLLMRVPPVLARPCKCAPCNPQRPQLRTHRNQHGCTAASFKRMRGDALDYALVLAAALGADAAVELFSTHLKSVRVHGSEVALVAAAAMGRETTVCLLDHQLYGCIAGNALRLAAGNGHASVVHLLIERGWRSREHLRAALERAAARGQIVALLLPFVDDLVDDLALHDERMDDALLSAVRGKSAAAVETLLRPWPVEQLPSRRRSDNLDDDYVDGVYMPDTIAPRQAAPRADIADIVWLAVDFGGPDVVRVLMSSCDPPPDVDDFVQEACMRDQPDVLRVMLEIQGKPLLSALHLEDGLEIAAFDCSLKVVELLLDWPDERAPRYDCRDLLEDLLEERNDATKEAQEGYDAVLEVLQSRMCRITRGQRTLEDCWGALVWRTVVGVGGRRRRRVGHFCTRGRASPNDRNASCAECVHAWGLA
ncbi:hypothetical protein FOA52_001081 [Chlamydomonas sp. UWO 241]|nr:hypothetical protein FOA52_001081 [Chlamydomonas sp. UWO 241]